MEEVDVGIIKECLRGNGKAFEEIVTCYKKRIYNIAYRFSGNKEDAMDITQEVFIKAYNSLKQYDFQHKFSSWILKITTNYCLDMKKKKGIDTVELDLEMKSSEATASAESVMIHKENRKAIKKAIEELPDEYKILIIMYHNQNLSYDEISAAVNIPMTKVKNRLYRARLMLKEKLQEIREEESIWTARELQY